MTRPSDALREVYERRGQLEYDRPAPLPNPLDRKFERIAEVLSGLLPCEAFLDAGCGDGRFFAVLASLGEQPKQVAGTDIAQSILETAGATANAAGISVELSQANLEELPYADRTFDVVLCTQVIEHLLEPAQGLRELRRVLRPGGRLLITTDNRGNRVSRILNGPRKLLVGVLGLRGRRLRVHFPHAEFDRSAFRAMLEEAGFSVRHSETFRFHLIQGPAAVQRLLNALDRRFAPHGVGDILLFVCET